MKQARSASVSRAGLFTFLIAYAAGLAALLPVLSLWLDEIYDLRAARLSLGALLEYVSTVPGNVPLPYLAQFLSVHTLGYTAFTGRLPSAIASLLAAWGIYVLARRMRLQRPLLAVLIFCILPLQLRYALEARPYAMALCLTIWSTVILLRWIDRGEFSDLALYAGLVCAGLYTFPFTLFVPIAHLAGLLLSKDSFRLPGPRRWLWLALAVGAAGLVFLPWYLHSAPLWKASVTQGQLTDRIGWRSVLVILKELTGAGYLGTLLILFGAGIGLKYVRHRNFWLAYLVLPILAAVAADAAFGYFLAIRQMIFVLAPLALLFAQGAESLNEHSPRAAAALALALAVGCLIGSFSFFMRPREDWEQAAVVLVNEPCVVFSPPDSRLLYEFFASDAARHECNYDQFASAQRVAHAVSPYTANNPSEGVQRELERFGLKKEAILNPAGPVIEIWIRELPPAP